MICVHGLSTLTASKKITIYKHWTVKADCALAELILSLLKFKGCAVFAHHSADSITTKSFATLPCEILM